LVVAESLFDDVSLEGVASLVADVVLGVELDEEPRESVL